jgi:hypothetical protein
VHGVEPQPCCVQVVESSGLTPLGSAFLL